jgi:hypothetical protein
LFLDLKTTSEEVNDACDLGEANHLAIGDVSDVGPPDEWEEMMFAHRIELDVLDHYDFARVGIENRAIDHVLDTQPITLGEKLEGTGGPSGRFRETLPMSIFAHRIKQICEDAFHFPDAIRPQPVPLHC